MKYSNNIHGITIETDVLGDNQFTPILVERLKSSEWEKEETEYIHLIDENAKVLELGGCLGLVSCLVNKRLKNPEKHIVLEANPELIKYLQHNRDINECSFSVENKVLHHTQDTLKFNVDKRSILGSSLTSLPSGRVKTQYDIKGYTWEDFEAQLGDKIDTFICDIEGGEYSLIQKVLTYKILKQLKFISIEFHGNPGNILSNFIHSLKPLNFEIITFKAAQGQTQLIAHKY